MSVGVRACSTPEEKRSAVELYNTVRPRYAVTMEDVEAWARSSLATLDLLGSLDGADVGSAAAAVAPARPHVCLTFITVLPDHRRYGVGGALFDATAAWAREQEVRELEAHVDADDEESLAFATRRGFRERARECGLALDLTSVEAPAVDPPRAIEIALLDERPELAAGAYEVGKEALPDIPGSEDWTPPPFEQFAAAHLHGLAVFVALAGGEVVGYAKLHARPDGRTAEHGMTAVRRAWRGRGVARALKQAEIAWAKSHGIERLTATNEERNVAIRRLNESLGYRPTAGRVLLRAPLE